MKRRAALLASGAWILAGPMHAFAQPARRLQRIAVLLIGTQAQHHPSVENVRAELTKLGHIEGRDILFEFRYETDLKKLPWVAAELVALNPAVVLTASSAGIIAFKAATPAIPIVFATAAFPVEQGFVASLARPEGNVTGVAIYAMDAKVVELVRQVLPRAKRIALLTHDADPISHMVVDVFIPAARKLTFVPAVVRVRRVEELALAFDEVIREKADALCLPGLSFMYTNSNYLVERALAAKLPLFSDRERTTREGGLLSYSTNTAQNFRRAAAQIDKILRGARPGELPVEQPELFRLVVNAKTAKAIGVSLSPAFLQRADRVIE